MKFHVLYFDCSLLYLVLYLKNKFASFITENILKYKKREIIVPTLHSMYKEIHILFEIMISTPKVNFLTGFLLPH